MQTKIGPLIILMLSVAACGVVVPEQSGSYIYFKDGINHSNLHNIVEQISKENRLKYFPERSYENMSGTPVIYEVYTEEEVIIALQSVPLCPELEGSAMAFSNNTVHAIISKRGNIDFIESVWRDFVRAFEESGGKVTATVPACQEIGASMKLQ